MSLLLTSLPFFFAPFPPSTDLAQHIAQIRLLRETLAGQAPELSIAWLAPNNLVYAILGLLSLMMPPVVAARVGLWLIVSAWALAILALASWRARSLVAALVAGVLAFQAGVYWGFIPFLVGWPVFVAWLQLTGKADPHPGNRRHVVLLVLVAWLLYEAHVLWFAVGGLWLVVFGLLARLSLRAWLARVAALAPGALLVTLWYPKLTASRSLFQTEASWTTLPWQRLYPVRLLETVMGGRAGPWPAVAGGVLLAWVVVALLTRWRDLPGQSDRTLLAGAGLFAVLVLFAPDRYMNTIFFAQRWAPCAMALLILGLPQPRVPLLSGMVGLVLVAACASTSLAWRSFTTVEMDGFQAALAATPANARVLELDTVRQSQVVGGQPFMQMMAYLQAEKGGSLSFSFAEHGSSLVGYHAPRELRWTPGLEWRPEGVRPDDVLQFDVVLLNGRPKVHQHFAKTAPVTAATTNGRWRLYSVQRPGR